MSFSGRHIVHARRSGFHSTVLLLVRGNLMFLHREIIFSGFVFWSSHMFLFLNHGYLSLSLLWLKGDLLCFSVVSFSWFYVLVYVNNQKFKKVKVRNRCSTLPQKTLPLKRLISSPLIL